MLRRCILLAAVAAPVLGNHWNYDLSRKKSNVMGPRHWADPDKVNEPTCGYEQQSPIDLKKNDIKDKSNKKLPNFNFQVRDTETFTATRSNLGLTLVNDDFSFDGSSPCTTMTGGPLGARLYGLRSMSFTWGGSEHKIRGSRKRAEIQFKFARFFDGVDDDTAFLEANVNVLIDRSSSKSKTAESNKIAAVLPDLVDFESEVSALDLSVGGLMPKSANSSWWYYMGSDTAPPCHENIPTIVMKNKGGMTTSTLKAFETLENFEGTPIEQNYRDIQDLNARMVFASFTDFDFSQFFGNQEGGGSGGSGGFGDLGSLAGLFN